jgi:hypothetical protein
VLLGNFSSRRRNAPPTTSRRTRPAHRWLAWLVVLLATALLGGVPVAAADPGWGGTEPENISHSPLNWAWQPVIAAGPPGWMVVAWSDQWSEGGSRNIYTASSDDNGRTWSAPTAVTETGDASFLPDALIVGDQVFVAWCDQSTTYPHTTTTYEAEVVTRAIRRIPGPPSSTSTRPHLGAGAGRLHVVFSAGASNKPDICHAMRPLTAAAWPTATVVHTHTHTGTGSWNPALALSPEGEAVHVVWEERASRSERAIMYMRGAIVGDDVDWTSPLTLSTGITLSVWPAIAADSGGNLHVVWGEQVGTGFLHERKHHARYRRYDAASGLWLPATRIDPEPVYVNERNPTDSTPSLTLLERGGQTIVCVVWHGFRKDEYVEPAEEVLLSCSRDGGQSWADPQNVSRSPGAEAISILPSVTFDGSGQLHSVWQERAGESAIFDYQIYHAHGLSLVFLPLVMRSGA